MNYEKVVEQKVVEKEYQEIAKNWREEKLKNEPNSIFVKQVEELHNTNEAGYSCKVDNKFYDPLLILHIFNELDKTHKLDNKEKLALFITCLSSELKNPADHMSIALKGASSEGKDNLIRAVLEHLPEEGNLLLTRGTTASLEDESYRFKRIAFSEINHHRERGVNKEIVETFKQMAEGGLKIFKKNKEDNNKTTKEIFVEQKTLLYGTTDDKNDEELETRYCVVNVRGYTSKNKIVVEDALKKARDIDHIVLQNDKKESWIAQGIRGLDHDTEVLLPYTEVFETKIEDIDGTKKYLFDYSKGRIKRDAKRLLSLTKAIAWIYQKQRKVVEIKGCKIIYSEPIDFLIAIMVFSEFFNFTYQGLNYKLERTLEILNEEVGKHEKEISKKQLPSLYFEYVPRNIVQQKLSVSLNTIKSYISELAEEGKVETMKFFSNYVLIMPVNMPVSNLSIPISLTGIDRVIDRWLIGSKVYNKEINKEKDTILTFFEEITHKNMFFDRCQLTGVKSENNVEVSNNG